MGLGKRTREDEIACASSVPPPAKRADAWNEFENMLKGDFPRSNYGTTYNA